ncbi:Na(+)/H(+) antiporter subunit B [Candidatus Sumerlaeota bacterium]|nr:Na(+)/H(+) antiporter subunit B [Candidatus Sumerlaeota bacterium]
MRKIFSLIILIILALGVYICISEIPFGKPGTAVGNYYIEKGIEETGAVNIVTSIVLNYRGFDTLGEVTILFLASLGLGAILATVQNKTRGVITPPSLILTTACRFLFPFILMFGAYIFLHGHLTPGGGFQGGAIIASGFLLRYLGCPQKRIRQSSFVAIESLGGIAFIIIGLLGFTAGGFFLFNFLPKGVANTLLSAGIIPLIYIAIGLKVGAEMAGIIDTLIEES